MVKTRHQIRKRTKEGTLAPRAASSCGIAPERLEWRRSSKPSIERPLGQAVEADFDSSLPVATGELDAVRRLLGDELDLFLWSLSGH